MEWVEAVRQLDQQRLHWRANVGGRVEEWEARITEQHPDERIAWKNTTGAPNAGVVTFHRLSDTKTRVMLQMEYDPQGVVENLGDMLGVVSRRVANDLERFKELSKRGARRRGPGVERSSGRAGKRRLWSASRVPHSLRQAPPDRRWRAGELR